MYRSSFIHRSLALALVLNGVGLGMTPRLAQAKDGDVAAPSAPAAPIAPAAPQLASDLAPQGAVVPETETVQEQTRTVHTVMVEQKTGIGFFDIGLDLGAITYGNNAADANLPPSGTAFEFEFEPRLGFLVHNRLILGAYGVLGFDGPVSGADPSLNIGGGAMIGMRWYLGKKVILQPTFGAAFVHYEQEIRPLGTKDERNENDIRLDGRIDTLIQVHRQVHIALGPVFKGSIYNFDHGVSKAAYGLKVGVVTAF